MKYQNGLLIQQKVAEIQILKVFKSYDDVMNQLENKIGFFLWVGKSIFRNMTW